MALSTQITAKQDIFVSHYYADYIGLWITTECGRLQVTPGEIVVIPQGFRFSVDLPDGPSRGYVAEIFGSHFQLPDLGPIGASTDSLNFSVGMLP